MSTIIKIYADWCMYCNLMAPEWDKMKLLLDKKKINNKPDILEIESQNIGMLDVFNKNHKGTNVKLNKYPTIAKYENGKVQYYKDEREAKKMLNWEASCSLEQLVAEMISADMKIAKRDSIIV